MTQNTPEHSELGKKSEYKTSYEPSLLFPIPRKQKREEIGIHSDQLPFFGFDLWNHYEVSWLNSKGKPMVAIAEIIYDCNTPLLIESKSMKLYFNSFNNTVFDSSATLEKTIQHDLSKEAKGDVHVALYPLNSFSKNSVASFEGENIDTLDIECSEYLTNPNYLSTSEEVVTETLCSDLLKSNCLVTGQPDWGSLQIHYTGKKINKEGLLKYIVSFRNHNEFHEQCIERIFVDIMKHCEPESLTVYGRYTRRGGLEINPCRSTEKINPNTMKNRLIRQ